MSIIMSKSIIAVVCFTFASPGLTFAADEPVGRFEYERNCMMCHGVTGRWNGWLAESLKQPVVVWPPSCFKASTTPSVIASKPGTSAAMTPKLAPKPVFRALPP